MRKFLFLLGTIGLAVSSLAQSEGDPNEGSQITHDAFNGTFNFSWWGRAGNTYFIQQSDDLLTWEYIPIIESGADETIEWGLESEAERSFFRLRFTNQDAGGDPFLADFDGDGVTNHDEIFLQGTDPLDYYNGVAPVVEKLSGDGQSALADTVFEQPLVVRITTPAGQALGNAPIVFSAGTSGAAVSSSAESTFGATASLRASADGTARAYVRSANSAGTATIAAVAQSGAGSASVDFQVTTTAPAYPTLMIYSGNNQTTTRTKPLFYPLVAQFKDASGQPAANSTVTFSVGAGGGELGATPASVPQPSLSVQTDANGLASVYLFTPDSVASLSVSATIGGGGPASSVTFSASARDYPTAKPRAPSGLTAVENQDGTTTLGWADNSGDEDEFIIECQKPDGSWEEVAAVGPDQTTFVVPAN